LGFATIRGVALHRNEDKRQVATVRAFLTVGLFKPAKAQGWESANRGYQLTLTLMRQALAN